MAISYATLFTRLGHGIFVQKSVNTSRGTTIPPLVKSYQDSFDSSALPLKRAMAPAEAANRAYQAGASSMMTGLQSSMQQVLIETVKADVAMDSATLTVALAELIRQMTADSESVDASTVAASASAITGNGDGVLVVSSKRADGKSNENLLAETIKISCTADSSPETASFVARGDAAVTNRLSQDWPGGSGIARTLVAVDARADDTILLNGGFDTDDDQTDVPDEWICSVGTPSTTIKLTIYEIQRIAITGPPTAGTYRVKLTNAAGKIQWTEPLAYNAAGSELQAALNALVGFEDIEVTTTGTSPLYTHDIEFVNVAGNVTALTIDNQTTSGVFTISTPTGGSANAFVRRAMEFDSDGSQLTTIQQPVTLAALKQYAVNLWAMADVVPVAGVITVDLVDGIGGSVIADQAGTNNSFTITCSALTTSFVAKNGVFRTPKILPTTVYLRIRITTAISAGTSVFLDHCAMDEMTELYKGGPSAKIFSGKTSFFKGDSQVLPDYFVLTTTNDRAGEFQEWFDRNFLMREKGLLLPSNAAGGETQADSLIA
jgi:hypothetical protein